MSTIYNIITHLSTLFLLVFLIYLMFSIANLNSTLMWNLILQIHFLSIVEFILSEPSVKIMVINMTVSSQREGTTYG